MFFRRVYVRVHRRRSSSAPGSPGSPAGPGSFMSASGAVGDVSASEAMMAQEVIADLRRQVSEFESHVRARDQAVAAAVAAFDSASCHRTANSLPRACCTPVARPFYIRSLHACACPACLSTIFLCLTHRQQAALVLVLVLATLCSAPPPPPCAIP